jgi:hypothetical protein
MSTRLVTLCFDANDPSRLAHFWAAALHWDIGEEADGEVTLVPTDGNPFEILFVPVPESKTEKNRLHLDVAPPADGDRDSEVERLVALGARRIDIGQGDVSWVVLGDPEGNEFCVLTPR